MCSISILCAHWLGVSTGEKEEVDLPVARAQMRGVHVLDDTQPVDEQQIAEHPAIPAKGTETQGHGQPGQATEPGLALTGADVQQMGGEQHADVAAGGIPDTLQQLGLDSPGLPDQAGVPQAADGQALATAEEPQQAAAPATTEPGSGALRPSTQEPDQAAAAWTPLASPDGWRSKRQTRSTETSPAPKSEGKFPAP